MRGERGSGTHLSSQTATLALLTASVPRLGTVDRTSAPRLLILDFGGVCVDPADPARVDPAAELLVTDGQRLGISVAVLSNELDDRTIATTPLLGLVDHVVSCNERIQKPDRRAFQRAMLAAGVEATDTLVVDDSIDNVRGARAAGAAALHFDLDDRTGSWSAVRRAIGLTPPAAADVTAP